MPFCYREYRRHTILLFLLMLSEFLKSCFHLCICCMVLGKGTPCFGWKNTGLGQRGMGENSAVTFLEGVTSHCWFCVIVSSVGTYFQDLRHGVLGDWIRKHTGTPAKGTQAGTLGLASVLWLKQRMKVFICCIKWWSWQILHSLKTLVYCNQISLLMKLIHVDGWS